MAEVVCDSFELLAAEITNITVVNIYVHANTAPDYPALRTALASIPYFATRNVIVGGDFNHPRTRAELEQTVMAPLGLSPTHDPDFPAPTHFHQRQHKKTTRQGKQPPRPLGQGGWPLGPYGFMVFFPYRLTGGAMASERRAHVR